MSRLKLISFVLASIGILSGCQQHADTARIEKIAPIARGEFVSGVLWQKPVAGPGETGNNSGNSPPKGSLVEVYHDFIIVTAPNGISEISLHGWYTNLHFKRE